MGLDKLKSIFNEGVGSKTVNYFKDFNASGFDRNFTAGSKTKYKQDSSQLDIESSNGQMTYTTVNKYQDALNASPFGLLPAKSQQLIQNSNNPLLSNHWDDIGSLTTTGPNNVSQEVDFLSNVGYPYGQGISNSISGFKSGLVHKFNTFYVGFDEGTSPTSLGDLLQLRNYPFVDDSTDPITELYNEREYDPRYPGRGAPLDKFFNEQNPYKGSALDELLGYQFNPLANDLEGGDTYLNIPSNAGMYSFTDSNILKLYNPNGDEPGYTFDPRQERIGVLPTGQTDVKFPNPKNPYVGTKFDDPLVAGLEGGGNWNTISDGGIITKYSDVFRVINTPSMENILEGGFMQNTTNLTALQKWETTTGLKFGDGTDDDDNPASTFNLEDMLEPGKYLTIGAEDPINLANSSWYYAGGIQSGIPNINTLIDLVGEVNSGSRSSTRFTIKAQKLAHYDENAPNQGTAYETMFDGNVQALKENGPITNDSIDIRYGSDITNPRGIEPYFISKYRQGSVPIDDENDFEDGSNATEASLRNKTRITSFLSSSKGSEFKTKATLASKLRTSEDKLKNWDWTNVPNSMGNLSPTIDSEGNQVRVNNVYDTEEKKVKTSHFRYSDSFQGEKENRDFLNDALYTAVNNAIELAAGEFTVREMGFEITRDILRSLKQAAKNSKEHVHTGIRSFAKETLGRSKGKVDGDIRTLTPVREGRFMELAYPDAVDNLEHEKHGLPFYFKDMRDNAYVHFRAYIDSITENLTPTWNEENFIGRSESVYLYDKTSRDIAFTLKLYAHSEDELMAIYEKMNQLTSMTYPQYRKDEINFPRESSWNLLRGAPSRYANQRPKPPLSKLRIGELFGTRNNELMGFIRSLNYSWPESGTWETRRGIRVPKHIVASITFQVIHEEVPNRDTRFYGIKGQVDQLTDLFIKLVDLAEVGRTDSIAMELAETALREIGQLVNLSSQIGDERVPGQLF